MQPISVTTTDWEATGGGDHNLQLQSIFSTFYGFFLLKRSCPPQPSDVRLLLKLLG